MTEIQIMAETEMTCAMTDVLLCLIAVPILLIIFKTKTTYAVLKKYWILFISSVGVASLLGFFAHFVFPEGIVNKLIWVVLYPLIMEIVVLFTLTGLCDVSKEKRPTVKDVLVLHLAGAVGVILAIELTYCFNLSNDIVLLTVFATALAVYAFALFTKVALQQKRYGERIMFASFIPILFGAYILAKQSALFKLIWYFDHNSVMHLCTSLGLIVMTVGVLKTLKEN